ncbi:MAG: YkgJ family cysteine cluster protein [Planctomycetia bacterium]|nr:YkgJ family cysteine cluster protein [Planctomycetia bacterium]
MSRNSGMVGDGFPERRPPWYLGGLRFECTGCGGCCSGAPGFVWVTSGEIVAMAGSLGISSPEFERRYVRRVGRGHSLRERPDGDCVLLDAESRKCQVYGVRPRQCRTWPFWDSNLETREDWERAAASCPGCNRGERIPFEEIRRRQSEIHI